MMTTNEATILASLMAAGLIAMLSLMAWIVRQLFQHAQELALVNQALSVLIQQVNPPGDKSLRELMHEIQLDQRGKAVTTVMVPPHDGGQVV